MLNSEACTSISLDKRRYQAAANRMFVREKRINGYTYLYLVETVREGGRAKQRIIKNLGRKQAVTASGALERLATSVARYAERALVLSQIDAGNPDGLACKRIGAPLLFGRLWEETGCRAVVEDLLSGRSFEFPVERAIFATVLHRIMVSGSDRACETWLSDYDIPGLDGLSLHHLYRAMAWLGEELPADEQGGATPFSPRTVKDRVEEELFARRRDLFSELSVVFFDTTSLSFTGAGGKSLGKRGYSKDHRPDLMQMIVGVVIDAAGRPVCSEMWPGNTADVSVLVPVIDRLRSRFAIGRVCVVADRGMISAATMAALEERGLEYLLGARERTDKLVRTLVLEDERPFTPSTRPRCRSPAPARLGKRGYSKDHRPDLMQMIVGVVIDAEGRPVCSEMWPGNTADVSVLVPVIDRLRSRFAIGRVCVVADRGMISAETMAALEARGLEYLL